MYHAYHAQDFVHAGREALLDEIKWETDGWPTINQGRGPSLQAPAPHGYAGHNGEHFFYEDFKLGKLLPHWQWPQASEPGVKFIANHMELSAPPGRADDMAGAVLAIRSTRGDYEAATRVSLDGVKSGSMAGLSAYGNRENALGIAVGNGKIVIWRQQKGRKEILTEEGLREPSKILLRLKASSGHLFRFATSSDGRQWKDIGANLDIEGDIPPHWDRGVRVALTVGGVENATGRFDWFRMDPVLKK
jgi:beta-xylosidase